MQYNKVNVSGYLNDGEKLNKNIVKLRSREYCEKL